MSNIKFKVIITVVREFEVPLSAYPEGTSVEEALAFEKESFEVEPYAIFDDEGYSDLVVNVEQID